MSSRKATRAPAHDGSKTKTTSAAAVVPEEANLDLLDEDDDFEEFPAETRTGTSGDAEDVRLRCDNWDDDDAHCDDFSNQLCAELKKIAATARK